MDSKVSWRQVVIFAQVAQQWVAKHPEKTKLAYAIQRVVAQLGAIETKVQQDLDAIDVEFCAVDEKGIVVGGPGDYKFEKEQLKLRNQARIAYYDKESVSIDSYCAAQAPDDLTEVEMGAFCGFVLRPEKVTEINLEREKAFNFETDLPPEPPDCGGSTATIVNSASQK